MTIEAVDFTRQPSPIILSLPNLDTSETYMMSGGKDLWPLQYLENAEWIFLPDRPIAAGEAFDMLIKQRERESSERIEINVNDSALTVAIGHQPVLVYNTAIKLEQGIQKYYQRSGFIHPAYSPAGQILTDDFPEGHRHQHGIFFAWVNTIFQQNKADFWNQQHQTGTILFDSLISYRSGPVFAEFITRQRHIALQGTDTVPVLSEQWTLRVYNLTDYFMWDIQVLQENISDSTLSILPYHYGGMAFRGSAEWNDTTAIEGVELTGPGEGGFLTSEGKSRIGGNHTRPQWVSMFGKVNEIPVNMTVIQSQTNPGAPHHVRIHPTMPYFCYVPVVEDGFEMNPGDLYKSSYRVLVFNDLSDTTLINTLYKSYNYPQESGE